jgi:rhodanese-related sulfurtransferase
MGRGIVLVGLALALGVTGARAEESVATVPRIGVAEAAKLLAEQKIVVVDSRSPERFRMLHIPGSINVPLGTESAVAEKLKKEKRPVVTVCT